MKTNRFICSLMAIAMMLMTAACSTDDPVIPDDPGKTPETPEDPGDDVPEPEGPVFTDGLYIDEYGSVFVQRDNGVDRVNGLLDAIESCADQTVTTSETGTEIPCNNTFILERGGQYYCEGKWVIKNNVSIKAAEGDGNMPSIQIMADATGNINADMIRIEANVAFEGIYFLGKDAMTGANQQRMLRIDGENCRVTLDHCFADYTKNFFIYIQNTGSKIFLKNSTFRNMSYNASSNGRLVDTRESGADTVLIHNCLVYNNLGHIVRFNGNKVNYLEWTNNTFYNVGTKPEISQPSEAVIENNIFANVGWRNAAAAIGIDNETQLFERDSVFWNIELVEEGTDISDVKITIRNNNIYNTPEMVQLYEKYPDTAIEPTLLSEGAEYLVAQGKMTYSDNIDEVLEYDNPAPIHYDFIDLYMSDTSAPDETYVGHEWVVDEDGIVGVIPGQVYTFGYPSSFRSATASTTGGPIGASL